MVLPIKKERSKKSIQEGWIKGALEIFCKLLKIFIFRNLIIYLNIMEYINRTFFVYRNIVSQKRKGKYYRSVNKFINREVFGISRNSVYTKYNSIKEERERSRGEIT